MKNDQEKGAKNLLESNSNEEKSNLRGDYGNFLVLLSFYFLQGMINGAAISIPYLLQARRVSYMDQAFFTLCYYPQGLKILWSPIVDSVYSKKFGRRKSWVIPFQILTALTLILSANKVFRSLGDEDESIPDVLSLTIIFTALKFFAATHEIAVNGWALTMLKKRNIGHIATAETIGLVAGFYTGVIFFIVLESKEVANAFIFSEPKSHGLITVERSMKFWGVFFLLTAIFVAIFMQEKIDENLNESYNYRLKKAYPALLKILKLKPVIILSLFLLMMRIPFGAMDSMVLLKQIEYGVPKEKLGPIAIIFFPFIIAFTAYISRYTAGRHPMKFYMKAFQLRILSMILLFIFVYFSPQIIGTSGSIPWYYYAGLCSFLMKYQCFFRAMYTADMAFFARIADPLIGGTYLTFLNTIFILGTKWPQSFSLWLVDYITWKRCIFNENSFANSTETPLNFLLDNKCENREAKDICMKNGGHCHTDIDGFYIEGVFSLTFAIILYFTGKRVVDYLEGLPIDDWHVLKKKTINDDKENF